MEDEWSMDENFRFRLRWLVRWLVRLECLECYRSPPMHGRSMRTIRIGSQCLGHEWAPSRRCRLHQTRCGRCLSVRTTNDVFFLLSSVFLLRVFSTWFSLIFQNESASVAIRSGLPLSIPIEIDMKYFCHSIRLELIRQNGKLFLIYKFLFNLNGKRMNGLSICLFNFGCVCCDKVTPALANRVGFVRSRIDSRMTCGEADLFFHLSLLIHRSFLLANHFETSFLRSE